MSQLLYNKSFTLTEKPLLVDRLLDGLIGKGELHKCHLVVPTGKLQRYYRNRMIRKNFERTGKPLSLFNVSNLNSFVTWAYGKLFASEPVRVVSDAYRLAIFEDAASIAGLDFFVKPGKPISLAVLKRLSDIVYGLKEDGIRPDDLYKDIANAEQDPTCEYNTRKLSDIAKLFEAYQTMMEPNQLDYPELLNSFNKKVQGHEENGDNIFQLRFINRLIPDDGFILLTGFTEFAQPEIEFLSLFAESKIPVCILLDYDIKNGPFLFGNIEDTINRLTQAGFLVAENNNTSEITRSAPPSLFLRRWLFNNEKDIRTDAINDSVSIYACEDRIDEVSTVARQIIDISANSSIHLKDICVAIQRPDLYANLFRQVFQQFGIPVNVTDRYPLANSPVTVAIFSLIDISAEGCRREDIHKALLNQYIRIENNGRELDGENFYEISARNRIQGGKRRGGLGYWNKKFNQVISLVKARIDICKVESEIDKNELLALQRELENTQKAFSDFEYLIKQLPDPNAKYTPARFASMIRNDIIAKLGIRQNITAFYNQVIDDKRLSEREKTSIANKIEKDARALKAFVRVLDEMCYILSDRYPGREFTLDDLSHRLKLTVSAEKYQVLEREGYGVTITSIEQTRGIPYQTVFLVGAVDREFPSAYMPESFLGKELPDTEKKHLHARRLEFFQFLTNNAELLDAGGKRIVITYPKLIDGNDAIRSPFIDSLLKITNLEMNNRLFDIPSIRAALRSGDSKGAQLSDQERELSWLKYSSTANELSAEIGYSRTYAPDDAERLAALESIARKENYGHLFEHICRVTGQQLAAQSAMDTAILNEKSLSFLRSSIERVYSVTELDEYVSCPFKYFLRRAMNLKETQYPESGLSPLEQGSLLHRILFLFYSKLQEKVIADGYYAGLNSRRKPGMPQIAPVDLDFGTRDTEGLLLEVAREELSNYAIDHPFFELEKEEILGTDAKPGLLREWYRAEKARYSKWEDYMPALFEFEFGTIGAASGAKAHKYIELPNGLRLKGKIDRIEIDRSKASKSGELDFIICDYKSSEASTSTKKDIRNGKSFQLPLYSAAMKKVFNDDYQLNCKTGGGLYYMLKPKYEKGRADSFAYKASFIEFGLPMASKVDKISNIDEVIDSVEYMALEATERIANGEFPVAPAKTNTCTFCDYGPICRIQEIRKTAVVSTDSDSAEE